jgi:cell division protein FtsW (lipid II flippase)
VGWSPQPDLGTALLVLFAGLYVIFFAGLSWRWSCRVVVAQRLVALLVATEPALCQPGVRWPVLREYQKQRVCTLLDPARDPLGKGFHIIQGMIAIGSGGLFRQGLHERHADAPGVHPRAHHRLHLRRLLRGVRPGRRGLLLLSGFAF